VSLPSAFVRTKHGIMTRQNAKALADYHRGQQKLRVEAARVRLESVVVAAGVRASTFNRLWRNAEDLLQRRLAEVRRIANSDMAEVAKTYKCVNCALLTDDTYKASCAERKVAPCFIRATLKGCPDLIPRAVIGKPLKLLPEGPAQPAVAGERKTPAAGGRDPSTRGAPALHEPAPLVPATPGATTKET